MRMNVRRGAVRTAAFGLFSVSLWRLRIHFKRIDGVAKALLLQTGGAHSRNAGEFGQEVAAQQ